ncbi:hypothetical protein BaRGS_00023969, partial [Batillaria attramentaria]
RRPLADLGIPLTLHMELGTDTAWRTGHDTETPAEQRCGDVEPNPGPMDENTLSDFLQRMEKTMQDQIKQQGENFEKLSRKIDDSQRRIEGKIVGTIVGVLTQHSTRRTWTIDDVERAHRVGPRQGNGQQPRPLIVRVSRWPDKMAVVQGGDLKQNLKDKRDKGSSRPDQATDSRDRAGQERGQVWLL